MDLKIQSSTPLLHFGEDDLNKILSKHATNLEIVKQNIHQIKIWIGNQTHLAVTLSDLQIFNFLLMNQFSIEKTKKNLDIYYTLRTLIPDFYKDLLPSSFLVKEMQKMVNLVPLPKLANNHNRIIAYKIVDNTNSNFSSMAIFRYLALLLEVKSLLDVSCNDEYILDFSNYSPGMVAKYTVMDIKNLNNIIEKMYSNRVAAFHIVKLPAFAEALLKFIRSCFNKELQNKFHFHSNNESLLQFYSKDVIPKDFGGDEKSMAKLNDDWVNFLDKSENHFQELLNVKVDESQRSKKLDVDKILGYHANFENLDVD